MEALTSSSSKVFSDKYRDRDRGFLFPRDVLSTPDFRFFRTPKHINVSFSRSISLQHRTTHPIFSSSSLSSSDTQNEKPQIQDIAESKTVHVKFQLQRECSFGQQFLIVGDDPMFGLWDTSNGVPLDWADGHVWTVELDIPIGMSIKFKFILKAGTEYILWQPGPDRILQIWDTKKTITVCEDWDNAELQKIIEEEEEEEPSPSNENAEKPMAIVAENTTDQMGKPQENTNNIVSISNKDMTDGGNIFGNNGSIAVNDKDFASTKDEGHLVSYEDVPILVPGLTPLPTAHTEEASPNEVEKNIAAEASLGADKAKDLNVPELDLKTEPDNESPHSKEKTEMVFNDEEELHDNEQVEEPQLAKEQEPTNTEPFDNGVLENDIQWGRRTLQKLLTNLGFL